MSIVFDDKYTVILKFGYPNNYTEILDWLNKNTSGSVDIKIENARHSVDVPWFAPAGLYRNLGTVFAAFENQDDALYFKIKFKLEWQ